MLLLQQGVRPETAFTRAFQTTLPAMEAELRGYLARGRFGNYTVLAGQVGLAGHIKIGNQVTIGSKSGVMHNIPDGEQWLGIPAQPDRQAKRVMIALQRLPDLLKKVAAWEKKLGGE